MLTKSELDNLEQITGIVMIDEIDMHLHPKWQWNIVNALSSVFENVQFIIATHSPIVISSSKEPNIILLEENKEPTYLPDCYGYSVEDILRYRQESVSRPKMINILINEITKALDVDDIQKADQKLERLKSILGEENSEYKNMLQSIEDAKLIMEY